MQKKGGKREFIKRVIPDIDENWTCFVDGNEEEDEDSGEYLCAYGYQGKFYFLSEMYEIALALDKARSLKTNY